MARRASTRLQSGASQRARETIHRRLAIAQGQQRVAGVQQNGRLIAAGLLGRFDVAQSLVALAQVRVGVRHPRIDQRIVGRKAQRPIQSVESTAGNGACRTSVSASASCSLQIVRARTSWRRDIPARRCPAAVPAGRRWRAPSASPPTRPSPSALRSACSQRIFRPAAIADR